MFRTGARAALRFSQGSLAPARTANHIGRRHLTTEPPHLRARSWKSSAVRWGIAAAGIYYYNTSPVFAEHPQNNLLNPNVDAFDDDKEHPTIDQITASSRNKSQKDASTLQSVLERSSDSAAIQTQENAQVASEDATPQDQGEAPYTEGVGELEAEAESEGAFNPVTGEINWDCPCLGGMAYGPCGDQFRAAFSCFIYSNEEPKGMECIDKFQGMQECFRAHPEVYKGELEDDDSLDADMANEKEELRKEIQERRDKVEAQQPQSPGRNLLDEDSAPAAPASTPKPKPLKKSATKGPTSHAQSSSDPQPESKTTSHTPQEFSTERESEHGAPSQTINQPKTKGTAADAVPESEGLVPKAAHDATDSSSGGSHSATT